MVPTENYLFTELSSVIHIKSTKHKHKQEQHPNGTEPSLSQSSVKKIIHGKLPYNYVCRRDSYAGHLEQRCKKFEYFSGGIRLESWAKIS